MESGVKLLLDELENALQRGARIRILTGNYLGIIQPAVLYLIKNRLGDRGAFDFIMRRIVLFIQSLICFIMQTITNRKEVDKGLTYEKYNAISDKNHIKKILKMPVHYLQESGKGFFVKKEGAALALKDEMQEVIDNPVFIKQMKDVVEYRVMDYYRR